MSLTDLLGIAVAVYVLLNFALLPRLTKAWKANRSLAKISKTGLMVALQSVRTAALVASIVYALLALLTLILGYGFGNNVIVLQGVVKASSWLHDGLESIKKFWDTWFFLVPVALIVYLSWRKQRSDVTRRFGRIVDDEYCRLSQERETNASVWMSIPPDEEMTSISAEIERLNTTLNQLSASGPTDRRQRKSVRREILQLKEKLVEIDYERRVRLEAMDPPSESKKTGFSWRTFLLSRGLFSDLKGVSDVLSRASQVLLAVALVGLAGTAADASKNIWSRVVHLDELRVKAATEKVEQEWEKRAHEANASQLTSDDRLAIEHLTNDFARALLRNPNLRPVSDTVRVTTELRENLARRAILREVKLPEPQGQNSAAFSDGLSTAEQQVLQEVANGKGEIKLGQIVADREGPAIKSWFGSSWESVKASILEHAKEYHEPLRFDDLEDSLLDHILSTVLDSSAPDFKYGEIGKEVRSTMNDATQKAINDAVTTELHHVVEDLAGGKSYKETIDGVRKSSIPVSKGTASDLADFIHKKNMPDPHEFREHMADSAGSWRDPDRPSSASGPAYSPSGGGGGGGGWGGGGSSAGVESGPSSANPGPFARASADATPSSKAAQDIVRDIAQEETENGRYSLPEEAVDALAEYDDHFPRSVAGEAESVLGRTLQEYRVVADTEMFSQLAELKVTRAASFSMLRGFSRVGGVLIGESPENPGDHADIRDLSWKVSDRVVTLTLKDASGHTFLFGPFDRAVVHQAIAYAADGRPVAVTMTTANPLPQLKIHLHPSLVDSPLGCRVEELDRLVDTYAGRQLPERGQITVKFEEQLAVYNVAWAGRLLALANAVGERGARLKQKGDQIIKRDHDLAGLGLKQADLTDASSILKRKPEFFDSEIVAATISCKRQVVDEFQRCVTDKFQSDSALENRDDNAIRRWVEGPASFMPWSEVRERKFKITPDLSFLREPNSNALKDQLWPFDFMVQIAFTSAAVNLPEKRQEQYVDERPVEFGEIQPKIEQLVVDGIRKDGYQPMFDELRQFTVLQRMFRAALKGYLGKGFPVEKLVQLTSDTAGAVPYFHTLRWNASETSQFENQLASAARANPSAPWMVLAANQATACHLALSRVGLRPMTSEAIEACNFERFRRSAASSCSESGNDRSLECEWKDIVSVSKVLPQFWRMEFAFGVLQDQKDSGGQFSCPAVQTNGSVASTQLQAER